MSAKAGPGHSKYQRLQRIKALDPEDDHREITELFYQDFQSVMLLQLVTGNLLTFAVPRMSRILTATGQFEQHTGKRVVDTALLTGTVIKHGFGPGPGRDAARRVNAMHRQYDIHPEDFVGVGCDIVKWSIEIPERFGWREVTDIEREGLRIQHAHEARAFGSHTPLPPTVAEINEFWDKYVQEQARYEPQNERLARAFLGYVRGLLPKAVRRPLMSALLAQVDPRVLQACGLRTPGKPRRALSTLAMRALGAKGPSSGTPSGKESSLEARARHIYPHGWTVDTLGTHVSSPGGTCRRAATAADESGPGK